MKNKIILGSVALVGVMALSSTVLAQSYGYINTNGEMKVETAATPAEALATAPNKAESSGVIELNDAQATLLIPNDTNTELYGYIDEDGQLSVQPAETPREAIVTADNRADTSGVILITM